MKYNDPISIKLKPTFYCRTRTLDEQKQQLYFLFSTFFMESACLSHHKANNMSVWIL